MSVTVMLHSLFSLQTSLKTQQMITFVQSMVTSGELNNGQANSLIVKLEAAMKNLSSGNSNAATNERNAFINGVDANIKSGKLSSSDGKMLIDGANAVINAIK